MSYLLKKIRVLELVKGLIGASNIGIKNIIIKCEP